MKFPGAANFFWAGAFGLLSLWSGLGADHALENGNVRTAIFFGAACVFMVGITVHQLLFMRWE